MRGAETGDRGLGLGPRGGVLGMGMRHAADTGEPAVEFKMCGEVGGGPKFGVDDGALQVADDHMFGPQFVVGHAAGFDGNQTLIAVDAAGIAKGVDNQAATNEFQVCLEHLFAECLQQHGTDETVGLALGPKLYFRKRLRQTGTLNADARLCQSLLRRFRRQRIER